MKYRDYEIVNKWWRKSLSIFHNGKEVKFENMEDLKDYVDGLY